MAFFKFRKAGDDLAASPRQSESIEAMRRRARHRLIGAAVLVLAGVIGFPLLFDTQPRPVAVDIPIEIPDRNKVKPLALPRAEVQGVVTPAPAASVPPAVAPPVVAAAPAEPVAAPKAEEKVPATPPPEPPAVAKAKPEPKVISKPEPVKAATSDDGAKARALLEGKPPAEAGAAAAEGRFVVQVGAFADATKAREARLRVEKAGLKTYTHVAETKDGKRIRVRVGPFASRGEADKAAEKIKGLDLPAAILTL
jgi:DedD protein